jgi:hypothetical protein
MGDRRQFVATGHLLANKNSHLETRLTAVHFERYRPCRAKQKSCETKPREPFATPAQSKRIRPYSTKWRRHINDWRCEKNCYAAIVRARAKTIEALSRLSWRLFVFALARSYRGLSLIHPSVSQPQHKRPHFVFHRHLERFGCRLNYDLDGVGIAMSVTARGNACDCGPPSWARRCEAPSYPMCALELMTAPGEQF